jgi:septal ring factor EnvC (AmiA/AmiB activator)
MSSAAAPASSPSYNASDLEGLDMRVIEELERRLAHLETRLEEVVDAKERLERHVAAQTEELRVQRAAIARTQRVLRGVVKSDDLPTEPAPKV